MNSKRKPTSCELGKSGVTLKKYVIGRRDTDTDLGTLNVGRYLALDRSMGSQVQMDALRPHAILICGKRGYGKSYTMGTLIEEIASLPSNINISTLVIDTMGIFWTMGYANTKERDILSNWGLFPKGLNIELFVPSGSLDQYEKMHIEVKAFSISTEELSGYDWCSLFGLSPISSLGVYVLKIIEDIKEKTREFSIMELIDLINNDLQTDPTLRDAAKNYFRTAISWGIFNKDGIDINEIIKKGKVVILDLSSIGNQNIKAISLKILGSKIYDERIRSRRLYEQRKMGEKLIEQGIPMVWMFIDEAHLFLPATGETPATDVLVNEWLRQGRQPGLSVVFATQRPAALHPDVMSQSDIIICHRLTAQDDINALEAVHPTYMRERIGDSLKKMGMEKGVAFIVDDNSESAHVVRMRPRKSWHGGDEPSALETNTNL
ncbi:MAG: ATP-binding protein [Candidatus Methanoperedens sp.]|nr:ATP-binding protein [Candidatus Methanoperedens sp.]